MNNNQSPKGVFGCFGIILILVGAGMVMDGAMESSLLERILGSIIVLACLFLWIGKPWIDSRRRKRRNKKQFKYSSIIGDYRNTPLDYIAKSFGYKRERVLDDILDLIKNGNFSNGFIDYDQDAFIMPTNRMIRQVASNKNSASSDWTGSEKLPKEYQEARGNLHLIINTRDAIDDEEMRQKLTKLYDLLKKMFQRLEEKPECADDNNVKRLLSYYLPTVYDLLDTYRKLSNQDIKGKQFEDMKVQLTGSLDAINKAIFTITNQLYDNEILDVSADLTVLQRMLQQDGYAGMNLEEFK